MVNLPGVTPLGSIGCLIEPQYPAKCGRQRVSVSSPTVMVAGAALTLAAAGNAAQPSIAANANTVA
jgi:hypothetical protein